MIFLIGWLILGVVFLLGWILRGVFITQNYDLEKIKEYKRYRDWEG